MSDTTPTDRQRRIRWTVGRMLAAGFLLALGALAVVGTGAYVQIWALQQDQEPVERSNLVIGNIDQLKDKLHEADRLARGYLQTARDDLFQRSAEASDAVAVKLAELRTRTADEPSQQRTLDQLEPLVHDQLAELNGAIQRQRALVSAGLDGTVAVPGPDDMTRIHEMLVVMGDREMWLLRQRTNARTAGAQRTRQFIVWVSVGTFLLVATAARWITRRVTEPAQQITAAAQRVIDGDLTDRAPVEGPEELARMASAVNAAMTAMSRARDEALAADAAKSTFLATMSHEIRTPMNAVLGMTALLRDTNLDEGQRELVETVRSSGESLLVIINDILDFSKIEAGELALDDTPFGIRDCVEGALGLVALTNEAKGLTLRAHVDPACPPIVIGDQGRLRQILLNLLGNAVKFTPHGEVTVLVDTVAGLATNGRVALRIEVRDSGIGIEPEDIGHLFDAFSQVDPSNTRAYGGTGLGLTISQRIARAMGGDIAVTSSPGRGSIFTVTVPVGIAPRPPQVGDTSTSAADTGPPARPLRILLAEDNAVNQRVAQLMLNRRGHQVDIVGNGADAIEAVHRTVYDVVLMDVQMPVLDGLQATERIRASPPAHGAPRIVALTAGAMHGDRAAALRAGMDGYLAKPIREEDLDAALGPPATASGPVESAAAPVVSAPAAGGPAAALVPDGPAVEPAVSGAESAVSAGGGPTVEDEVRARAAVLAGADAADRFRLAGILDSFIRRLPDTLAKLDAAAAIDDVDRLARLAHGLRGSAATLGADRLAEQSTRLEAAVAVTVTGDDDRVAVVLDELRRQADAAVQAMRSVAAELNEESGAAQPTAP